MARINTLSEAQAIAAAAMDWLKAIRNAQDAATLNKFAADIMARCDRMGVCFQIKQHIRDAIAEERERHGERPIPPQGPAVRGKDFAAGHDA